MEADIRHGPANAAVRMVLGANESFTAEAGSMIAMSGSIAIETTTHKKKSGGVLKALGRMLAGESFFLNHFTAGGQGGEVWLAPTMSGDIISVDLKAGDVLVVQSGSYLACSPDINVDLSWQGFKSFFSGESVFWLKLSGTGQVVLSSFGAIYPLDIDGEYIVDTGHIVAFPESLPFEITKAGSSWISSMLGGEGLVTRFKGRGRIWCQSHNASTFGKVLGPMLRPRES